MKKIFYLSMIVVALSLLASAGILWAAPGAAVCPAQGKTCVESDGGLICSWTEEVAVNKLVPGRAGQMSYVLVPSTRVRIEKCADGVPESLK